MDKDVNKCGQFQCFEPNGSLRTVATQTPSFLIHISGLHSWLAMMHGFSFLSSMLDQAAIIISFVKGSQAEDRRLVFLLLTK